MLLKLLTGIEPHNPECPKTACVAVRCWHFSDSHLHRRMSAIRGKADMTRTCRYVRAMTKRTFWIQVALEGGTAFISSQWKL